MKKQELFEQITNSILSEIENGKLVWRRPWKQGLPANYISKQVYQGINFLLLCLDNVSQPFYLTFLQAKQKELHIKKGAKGRQIIFYKMLSNFRQNNKGELEDDSFPMLRYSYVFNLDDIEGCEIPTPTLSAPSELLQNIISIHNPTIENNTTRCYYSQDRNLISTPAVNSFTSEEEYFSSLFHELVHWTGHKSRLNRQLTHDIKDDDYSFEELIAEIGSSYLCGLCGIENTLNNSAAYLNGWLKIGKMDKTFIPKAAIQAQKAVNYLINKTEDAA